MPVAQCEAELGWEKTERETATYISGVQIRSYSPPNWFTERGVRLKRAEIERKGLRSFKHCLLVTLTIPEAVVPPRCAFEKGRDRLRRFLSRFRKALGRKFPWAWKLEFQENGYPHWHLIIGYKKRIPREMLFELNRWWGLGMVNVQRLRRQKFVYLFKYVSKMASSSGDEEAGLCLPAWVLDYRTTRKDGRPSAGIRFWQTGGSFYTKGAMKNRKKSREQMSSRIPYTLREQIRLWARKTIAFRKDKAGQYLASTYFYFNQEYARVAHSIISRLFNENEAPVENSLTFRCHPNIIKPEITPWIQKQLHKVQLHQSRMATVYFSVA